ncbi:MAG TPA: hypothetical protein VK810_05505, partial [Dongiaceae bacterium]|nr:hypothetical protein [Dongiaceae bacterium]
SEMRRRPQMDKDPFQKATGEQKRIGGFFMAVFPIFAAIFFGWISLCVVVAEHYGRFSLILLYIVLLCVTYYSVAVSIKVAPKIPLSVSVPISIVSWSPIAWMIWKTCF